MKRMCPAHGMVETVFDGTCAVCGAPTLNEANPEDREEIIAAAGLGMLVKAVSTRRRKR